MAAEEQEKDGVEEEEVELRKEIFGGFVIYGVLALCALFSLFPVLLTGRFPERAASPGRAHLPKFESKVLVACFFSLEEPSSREQVRRLEVLRGQFSKDSVSVIAMCVSRSDAAAVAAFARSINASFPVVVCPKEVIREVCPGGKTPVTMICDANGNTKARLLGPVASEDMTLKVERILQ